MTSVCKTGDMWSKICVIDYKKTQVIVRNVKTKVQNMVIYNW